MSLTERLEPSRTNGTTKPAKSVFRAGGNAAATSKYAPVTDKAFIDTIIRSLPLYDIGKDDVLGHILLKPGRLTSEEFKIMKRHSVAGGDTVRTLVEQG